MDTRDDGADDSDGRRDGTDSTVDRRGGPNRTRSDPKAGRPDDDANADTDASADRVPTSPDADARDDGNDEVGIAEAVGEDRPPLGPLEPGSPTPENVLFVVLGALATVALIATLL